jgi:integrase
VERVAVQLGPAPTAGDDRPAAARVRVAELTPTALVDALAAIQRSGAAPASRSRIHGTLEQLCKHLVHQGELRVDPLTVAGLERPKLPRSLPRYIERDDDISRVLTAAATPDPSGRMTWAERDLALAAVLAGTGTRASELCGVRFRDLVLDVEDPYVRVVGKGDVTRDCPLPPEVVLAIEAYLAGRRARTGRRPRPDEPVWLNNHGDSSRRPRSITTYGAGSPGPACPSPGAPRRMRFATPSPCSSSAAARRSTSCRRCSGMRLCDRPRSIFALQATMSARPLMASLCVANS